MPAPQLSRIRFEYQVVGAGWANARISNGILEVELMPSYLSDALGDLIWAVVALLEGSQQQVCEWQDEPGGWRWELSRQESVLNLLILRIDAPLKSMFNKRVSVVFHETCNLRQFAIQLHNQLWKLVCERGFDGYEREWRHRFPVEQWKMLGQLISQSNV